MKTKDCCSQFYLLRKCIFSLVLLIIGVLLIQSAQAQPPITVGPPLLEADGVAVSGPDPGTYNILRDPLNAASGVLNAINGGTITGKPGNVTLNLVVGAGAFEARMLRADGLGSKIDMTGVQLDINIPDGANEGRNRAAMAETGGKVILTGGTIFLGSVTQGVSSSRALESDDPFSFLSATNTNVNIKDGDIGAFAFSGGALSLSGGTVTRQSSNGYYVIISWALGNDGTDRVTTLDAKNTMIISVPGSNGNVLVGAYRPGATTTIDNCTVTGSGTNNWGLWAVSGGEIDVRNHSTVTSAGSNAALVDSGSVLKVSDSTIHGDLSGIVITDEDRTPSTNLVTLTNSKLTNAGGNREAAFKVEAADANITVTNSTVDSGTEATQHTLLDVSQTQTQDFVGRVFAERGNETTAVIPTPRVGNQPSLVNLTAADNSILNGDILVDASSTANVSLERNSVLTGAINENNLTGATGINPTEQVTHPISPALSPLTVNLGIDSTSTWNMTASSTINTLTVNPQAHINFGDPPADPFKTLLVNNLMGTGGIFKLNNDLAAIKGDLIEILTKSEGQHLLTFNNRTMGSDLPVNTALLVVRTPDGGAAFRGEEDGGTFRYFVVHGDGSSVTPVRNDWYLVRGDEITPPETTPPPPTNPNPAPPAFTPGDVLPLPAEPPPRPLSLVDDLTPAANAAIGTFSAAMPLFYADMDTLIERMGELRLQTQEAPAPTTTIPSGTSKEGGKEVVASPPPVTPPAGGGVWVRGFGSGTHINDQVSGSFHQNLGGFQVGADKRLVTRYGDLYLGAFSGYFYAHRDFQEPSPFSDATGTTSAFSVGAYSTLIHPSGFYADLVVKYTQLWNDFNAPNLLSSLGLGSPGTANYSIPTFGASLEIGKRWDFGHFFLEPQGQIEGAWAGGTEYTVSTGLRVNADSQTSLRGRLGIRAGYHFDWGSMAFEPYAKVSVINEFLSGDRITTNQTSFFPTLSGVGIQAAAGVTARLTNSTYLYGEYDYANSDKVRTPFAVAAGIRLVW